MNISPSLIDNLVDLVTSWPNSSLFGCLYYSCRCHCFGHGEIGRPFSAYTVDMHVTSASNVIWCSVTNCRESEFVGESTDHTRLIHCAARTCRQADVDRRDTFSISHLPLRRFVASETDMVPSDRWVWRRHEDGRWTVLHHSTRSVYVGYSRLRRIQLKFVNIARSVTPLRRENRHARVRGMKMCNWHSKCRRFSFTFTVAICNDIF